MTERHKSCKEKRNICRYQGQLKHNGSKHCLQDIEDALRQECPSASQLWSTIYVHCLEHVFQSDLHGERFAYPYGNYSTYWSQRLESPVQLSHVLPGLRWISRVACTESAMNRDLIDVIGTGGRVGHPSALLAG